MPQRRVTRCNPSEPTPTPDPTPIMDSTAIEALVSQRVVNVVSNYETKRNTGFRNDDENGNGGGSNSNFSNEGGHRACNCKDFMNCKPKYFFGNEGVVGLTRWIEKMKLVFEISFFHENCHIIFATCTFSDAALTWWNGHAKTLGISNANAT